MMHLDPENKVLKENLEHMIKDSMNYIFTCFDYDGCKYAIKGDIKFLHEGSLEADNKNSKIYFMF